MLGQPRTTIQPVKDGNLGERKHSFVLRPSINAIVRREPRPNQDQDVGRTNVLLEFGWWPKTRLRRKRSIPPMSRRELKPSARSRKPSWNLRKKGELPCRTRSANDVIYLQLLWQNRQPRRGVPKKRSESASTSQQLANYAANVEYDDYGGLFVMRHRVNSMTASDSASTSNSEDAWFVDFGASHHMTSHQ